MTQKKNIDDLKRMLRELADKVNLANEENEAPTGLVTGEENPLQDDSGAKKGKPDNMAEAYRAAYQKNYNELSTWKKQAVDSKSIDDRIYKELIKQVIRDAETV